MLKRQQLSALIIAKNEPELLKKCLASVKWADEIILLFYGKIENSTKEIARSAGAKVFQNDTWEGYGKQRQHIQKYATFEMILMIDTDEHVTPELRLAIEEILLKPKTKIVYSFKRDNLFLGRFMRYSGWSPDYVIRLYPSIFQFNNNLVHESLETKNTKIKKLKGSLKHYTYRNFIHFQKKQLLYAEAWAKEQDQIGKQCKLITAYIHSLAAFIKTLLLRGGVFDGKHGWILAIINAQYTFNKYLRLWELNNYNPHKKR